MSDELSVQNTPETPVELPELVYTYQPEDEDGFPLGGRQVIKYRTQEELADKLRDQNVLLVRRLRAETRKNRLGTNDVENIPQEAQRYTGPVEFKPRELSQDEITQLSHELLDPTTAVAAQRKIFEASVGVSPETLSTTLQKIQEDNLRNRARLEADAFILDNPDYVRCDKNTQALIQWLLRYDLDPIRENFQRAYDTLKSQDPPIIVLRKNINPTDPPSAYVATQPVQQPTQSIPVIPVSLHNGNSSNSGTQPTVADQIVYKKVVNGKEMVFTGFAAIEVMPSEEYKHRINHDPVFVKAVNKLYSNVPRAAQVLPV